MYSKLSQLEGEPDAQSRVDVEDAGSGPDKSLVGNSVSSYKKVSTSENRDSYNGRDTSSHNNSQSSSHSSGSSESHNELTVDENSPTSEKLSVLVSQAVPVVLSFFLGIGGNFINLIFAGHFALKGDSSTVFAG